ncbi:MAG: DUF1045 domain-containing protein [Beijerinckiaceae bacterium]
MDKQRFAIYLAPPPDASLWRFGSRVLGYDAATGEDLTGFAPAGITPADWREMTARPRVYGFHATLKAPFRLADGMTQAELETALDAFCQTRPAFDLGPLAVQAIDLTGDHGFAALVPVRPSPALAALEQDVVRSFEGFRAPLTESERQKRKPDRLTQRQRDSLDQFGYPHTGPDYQFHMTLSSAVDDIATVADNLADAMANDIGTAHLKVDALVLFKQDAPDQRFRIIRRIAMTGTVQA